MWNAAEAVKQTETQIQKRYTATTSSLLDSDISRGTFADSERRKLIKLKQKYSDAMRCDHIFTVGRQDVSYS